LHDFDDVVTAPLHGFSSADDYWTRASAKPVLGRIGLPTLVLNARNDPFMPDTAFPRSEELSPFVLCEFPEHGGHVGFVGAPFPGNVNWLPRRVTEFFEGAISGRKAGSPLRPDGIMAPQRAAAR
jgi:predicted alpha/beta-fold hydrolase